MNTEVQGRAEGKRKQRKRDEQNGKTVGCEGAREKKTKRKRTGGMVGCEMSNSSAGEPCC